MGSVFVRCRSSACNAGQGVRGSERDGECRSIMHDIHGEGARARGGVSLSHCMSCMEGSCVIYIGDWDT